MTLSCKSQVLNETKTVDGVVTRVVEEKEWKKGKLYEIARNYFAICEQTKDVFYFGEDVNFYENDKVVKTDGSWMAGKNGAKAGLMMPGSPKLNMKVLPGNCPGCRHGSSGDRQSYRHMQDPRGYVLEMHESQGRLGARTCHDSKVSCTRHRACEG